MHGFLNIAVENLASYGRKKPLTPLLIRLFDFFSRP
jgi:hypothetical protein